MKNKMKWLIDAFNNNTLDKTFKFRISESGKDFGTICMPTGTGKSGVIIENIIHRIIYNSYNRLIINISCPTLRLSQQLICDLFETMQGALTKNFMQHTCLVINSSDSPENYNVGTLTIYSGDLNTIMHEAEYDNNIIIVASCHRSLYKFVEYSKQNKNNIVSIINYIDESHLLPYKTWSVNEEDFKVDLYKLHIISDALYLFSATPDYKMTCEFSDNDTEPYIYKMYPIDAINDNIILPPRIRCLKSSNISDSALYINILKECKVLGGNRKVLITLKSTDELRMARQTLENFGYKVFSVTAADGFTGGNKINDAVEFADIVDKWDGDCFVLQIKQLTQGTDIRTLTDCVIPVADEINSKTYRNLIQTMGRVLRTAPGERGVPYNRRTKKAGNIFFILTIDSDSDKECCMRRFALRYYGMECAFYGDEFRTPAEMTDEIENTKEKIKQYIYKRKNSIKINIQLFESNLSEESSNILEEIDPVMYYHKRKSGIPEYHLLDNRLLLKYTEDLISKVI